MAKRKKPIPSNRPVDDKSADSSIQSDVTKHQVNNSARSLAATLPGLLVVILAVFTFSTVALQPVSHDLTWWQLSCGRQVITHGTLWPSVDLLVNESRGDSTAIGAAATTAVYLLAGASGWMLLRVLAVTASVILVVFWSRRCRTDESSTDHHLPLRLACLSISLAAISFYLDPVPILFDIVATGLLAVWFHSGMGADQSPTRNHFLSLALLFLFWANFGNLVFVGISLIVAVGLSSCWNAVRTSQWKQQVRTSSWSIAVAIVSATFSPIGLRVWIDSFSQTVPWAVALPWTLAGTDWVPLTQVAWGWIHFVFLLLTLIILVTFAVASQRHTYFSFTLVLQLFAWSSAIHVPLAIIGMTVQVFVITRHLPVKRTTLSTIFSSVAMAGVFIAMIRTVGWGFDADLDPRMLEIAIADVRSDGSVLADDSRSTGMMAWVLGPVRQSDSDSKTARLQDEPRRALVGGRLLDHRRLFADLRDSQQMSYWREDESQGGWWLPLTQRGISLLACSRRDLQLIRRLEPTIWKPLTLDSPVLLYARAGDPIHTPKIVDVLGQRDWVNSGMWQYQPPPSTGSAYDRDRFGLLPAPERPDQTFDQADVFAAMDLQIAALSVLDYARQRWADHPRYVSAWRRCQVELADGERVNVGQASLMRTLASGDSIESVGESFKISAAVFGQWERLIAVYQKEGASVALQACEPIVQGTIPEGWESIRPPSSEQMRYAAVCWAMESGRREDALRWAKELYDDDYVSPTVRLLAQHQLVSQNWIEGAPENRQEESRQE